MGIIRYKDVPYGGGGSSVTPNPSGTATANLEKVQIESTVYAIKDSDAVHGSDKGTANGVASLDANGKVPSAQLPSYVDDVVEGYYDTTTDRFYEESTFTTVIPPEDGKSWVDVASNKSYRWTGSVYVRVDEGVQLGETSNTAYRGDRGKTAYDHATESGKISSAVASGLYKIAATAEGHIASLTAAVKADFTALGLLDKSGDTMTGDLIVRADVIIDNDSNGGGHDLIIGHANASDSEQPCYIKFYRGQVSAITSLQAQQNINYDPDTGRFTPDANNYNILLPCKSGTVALISDIQALDGVITGSAGAGKTLTAFSQTDGKVTATFSDISITKSQISDFPTIPTVNNSTITIKKNGTTVDSFTLNQSTGKDIDISVPTKTSDLTNDSGFVTTDEITEETDTDSTPYLYRPSQSNGDRLYEKLVGASFGVNQLNDNLGSSGSGQGITYTKGSNGRWSIYGKATANSSAVFSSGANVPMINNHIYYVFGCPSGGGGSTYFCGLSGIGIDTGNGGLYKYTGNGANYAPRIDIRSGVTVDFSDVFLNVIDLTLMFGTDIANKAYTMEQSTAGSGIAWLKSYGFFTKDYYPNNTGELLSVKPTGKVNVGKNIINLAYSEEGGIDSSGALAAGSNMWRSTEYTRVSPNTKYTFSATTGYVNDFRIYYYDSEKNFIQREIGSYTYTIPSNCYYIKWVIYHSAPYTFTKYLVENINLQLERGENPSTYEPYTEYTYPISTELRGIAKLVGNDIVYDGDVDDGKNVQRKYGIVKLGDLTWNYDSGNRQFYTSANAVTNFNKSSETWVTNNIVCGKYIVDESAYSSLSTPHVRGIYKTDGRIYVIDTSYSDSPTFKQAMTNQNVELIYELATPTTEPSNGFTMPQIVSKDGTEQFIDERTAPIPVGHDTTYIKVPDWMEEYYPKDFRKRVDYPEDSGEYVKNESLVGNYQAITGFDSPSNCFITPTDGYIVFSVPSATTDKFISVYFMIGDYTNPFVWLNKKVGGNGSFAFEDAMFVKKDTKCYVYSNTASATLSFFS